MLTAVACAVDSVIELEVKVAGMQCGGCADRVVEALQVCGLTCMCHTYACETKLPHCY